MTQAHVDAPFDLSALVARFSLVNAAKPEEAPSEAPQAVDAVTEETPSEAPKKPRKGGKKKPRTVDAVEQAGELETHEMTVHYASNSTVDAAE